MLQSSDLHTKLSKKYENITKIGEGAYGEVYAATELKGVREGKQVVLKICRLHTSGHAARFQTECKILEKLKTCSHVCPLYTWKTIKIGSVRYGLYVMEKLDVDLLNILVAKENIPERTAKMIFRKIVEGVEYCHSQGVAHLDLKPDNVLLRVENGELKDIKLCDFGFAKRWEVKKNPFAHYSLLPMEKIGTIEYAAPELVNVSRVGSIVSLSKADVYSLGVILFTLVTGSFHKAFAEDGTVIQSLSLTHIKNFTEDDKCYQLLIQLLADDPEDRPTAQEILSFEWFRDL